MVALTCDSKWKKDDFQDPCKGRFDELQNESGSALFRKSHDMAFVRVKPWTKTFLPSSTQLSIDRQLLNTVLYCWQREGILF